MNPIMIRNVQRAMLLRREPIGPAPMITVPHETLQNRTVTTDSVMDHPWMRWLRPVFGWSGGGSAKNADRYAGAFGWKHALELIPVTVRKWIR